MKKYTKKEQLAITKQFKEAEERVMAKIKARMAILAKDKRLAAQMQKDIQKRLKNEVNEKKT